MNPDVSDERFRALAGEAWDAMPEAVRNKVDNVALLVEDEPSEETRARERLGPQETLLGLYHGIPESERGGGYGVGGTLPDTITLYRIPILEEADLLVKEGKAPDFDHAIRMAIEETLWHEVGHYFGLHEAEVRTREHKGTNRFHGH